MEISKLEAAHILDKLDEAMAELEQSEEISQGVIDGLVEIYAILGVKYEQN